MLGFDRPNIKLSVAARNDGKRQLLDFVRRHAGRSGIVYCLSRKKTEETAAFLDRNGMPALAYHAGMTKEARDANQNRFMTEAGIVMVATIAFGMGIDKPDVAYVFHTDLPGSLEAYYQEIGRAGRDGAAGARRICCSASAISACGGCSSMTRRHRQEHKRRAHGRLGTLIGYCETAGCRRQILLGYFGEMPSLAAIATIAWTRRRAWMARRKRGSSWPRSRRPASASAPAHIVDVLRGGETQKILDQGPSTGSPASAPARRARRRNGSR